jgi:hypothetical protein
MRKKIFYEKVVENLDFYFLQRAKNFDLYIFLGELFFFVYTGF